MNRGSRPAQGGDREGDGGWGEIVSPGPDPMGLAKAGHDWCAPIDTGN